MAAVDTRPVIAAGGEPFEQIMAAVDGLAQDKELAAVQREALHQHGAGPSLGLGPLCARLATRGNHAQE
ncbi:MAG: hypothetical protein ACRDND_04050 [Streptosporangiaceae bacterium]